VRASKWVTSVKYLSVVLEKLAIFFRGYFFGAPSRSNHMSVIIQPEKNLTPRVPALLSMSLKVIGTDMDRSDTFLLVIYSRLTMEDLPRTVSEINTDFGQKCPKKLFPPSCMIFNSPSEEVPVGKLLGR